MVEVTQFPSFEGTSSIHNFVDSNQDKAIGRGYKGFPLLPTAMVGSSLHPPPQAAIDTRLRDSSFDLNDRASARHSAATSDPVINNPSESKENLKELSGIKEVVQENFSN